MEKRTSRKIGYFGLLNCFIKESEKKMSLVFLKKAAIICILIFCAVFTFAATTTSLESFETNVKKGEEVIVKVRITETTLKKVNYTFDEPSENVRRMLLKKYVDPQNSSDVIIESVFIFDESGSFKLPPLIVKIGQKKHTIDIPTIEVSENAKLKTAEVFWDFNSENEIQCALPIELNLKIRYVSSIESFDVPLDEHAAISRKTAMILSFDENADFVNGETAAVYQWIPLEEGKLSLPKAELEVTGTNGEVQFIKAPEIFVNVIPSNSIDVKLTQNEDSIFSKAFIEETSTSSPNTKSSKAIKARKASAEELKPLLVQLAELRAKEHEALFKSDTREQRKILENQLELHDTPDENPQILLILWISITFLFLISSLILKIQRKKIRSFLLFLVGLLCFVRGVHYTRDYRHIPGIFTGGEICTVPDAESLVAGELTAGTRINVVKKVGNWALIEYDGRKMGWVNEETIIPINISFILTQGK